MVHTLWHMGFPAQMCKWVASFLSDRKVSVHLNDSISPLTDVLIGVPQGSPVSPILSCLYAAPIIKELTTKPIFSSVNLPVGPRMYMDDLSFLAILDSLGENCTILTAAATHAANLFEQVGITFDLEKMDGMHFSWRREALSSLRWL